jgi:hypothetical protein
MKKTAWALALAGLGFASVAAAGDLAERRDYEPGSYSAQLYYRVDFGGIGDQAPSLGLRFDNERAAAAGAPALMQARFGARGIDRLTLSGTEVRGPSVAANQVGGFFSSLTTTQWVALIFTTIVLGTVAIDATEESDEDPAGTGGT